MSQLGSVAISYTLFGEVHWLQAAGQENNCLPDFPPDIIQRRTLT